MENLKKWTILLALSPLVAALTVEWVTRGTLPAVFTWVGAYPGHALLVYLGLLGLMTLLTFAIGRLWAAYLIPTLPFTLLAAANYLKLAINGEPILVSDLALTGRAGDLLSFIPEGTDLSPGGWMGILIEAAWLAYLIFKGPALPELFRGARRRWYAAVAAAVGLALILAAPTSPLPADDSQAARNRRWGLGLGLYAAAVADQPAAPTFDPDLLLELPPEPTPPVEEPPDDAEPAPPPVRPNVIVLMSESFCDPLEIFPGVEMAADPIPNFRALLAESSPFRFYSNTYGGGTGNVEMEVLTGIPISFLPEDQDLTTIPGDGVYSRLPSIVHEFKNAGYTTHFVHSHTTALWNRVENLPQLGFDTLTFDTEFPEDVAREGAYISDLALTEQIIRMYEEKDPDTPFFLYAVSMENHQPYDAKKFGAPSGLQPACDRLTQADLEKVDCVLYGVRDADAALKALVDYFRAAEEPTLIVFFGDHLPGLYTSATRSIFSVLGYVPTPDTLSWDPEVLKRMHITPGLVWTNYGATLDVPADIGAMGLGTALLGWSNVEKSFFYQWEDRTLNTMLEYRRRLYIAADGTPYHSPPRADALQVNYYKALIYQNMTGADRS